MNVVSPTVTTTVVARNPLVGTLAIVAILIVALAGFFIYRVIRKGL
jgi:hypothetical protein